MNACVLGVAWTSASAAPAHEVVFGAVAWRRPLRSVVLLECPGLLEDLYDVVEVLAGDLVRQGVVAGPVSGTQAYIA
jgi:hypothetical protein